MEPEDIYQPTAEQLYASRSAVLEVPSTGRRFGVAEIHQVLCTPGRSLTTQEQRTLFADPRLSAAFRQIKSQVALVAMPRLAAASDGEVRERHFDGHSVRILQSRVPGQTYVMFRFKQPFGQLRLVLEGPDGQLVIRELPAADPNGDLIVVLDDGRPDDQAFRRLLSDPTTTGSFIP